MPGKEDKNEKEVCQFISGRSPYGRNACRLQPGRGQRFRI